MKRFICLIISVSLMLFSAMTVSAAGTAVEVQKPYESGFVFPEGFSPITKDTVEENAELLDFLGISQSSMHQYFDEKNFLAFSISEDYREQIYIIAEQNDVSAAIGNLSDISDPASVQSLLVGDIEGEGGVVTVTEPINGEVYFYVIKEAPVIEPTEDEQPRKTEPCMVYYVTVIDSVAYVVTYSNEGGKFTDEAKQMMSAFVNDMKLTRGPDDPTVEEQNDTQIIVNWVLIALASGILIYAAVTIFTEFRKRRLEEDFKQKAPKKPLR